MALPLKTSLPTPSPMKTISITELQNLKASLQKRHRFMGRWAAPVTGFFDGFYDNFAIANIGWLLLGGVVTLLLPPLGIAIILLSAAAAFGGGVSAAMESYEAEKKSAAAAEALLDKAIADCKTLALNPDITPDIFSDMLEETLVANGITDKALLDTLLKDSRKRAEAIIDEASAETALPAKTDPLAARNVVGEKIDSIDSWSRHIRNAFGLGAITTMLVYGIPSFIANGVLGLATVNVVGLAAIAGGMVLQLVPKILQNYFVESHRKEATQEVEILVAAQEAKIVEQNILRSKLEKLSHDIVLENVDSPLEENELIRSRSMSLASNESSIAGSLPSYHSNPDSPPGTPEPAKITASSPIATSDLLSEKLKDNVIPASDITMGQRYAVTLGAMHGGLHPLAWLAIAAFVLGVFIPGVNIGIIVLAVGAALTLGGAIALGSRAQEKEMEAAKKEDYQRMRAQKITEAVELTINNYKPDPHSNRLQTIYQKHQKYLENRLKLGSPRYNEAMEKLDKQYKKLKEDYNKETEKETFDEFKKIYNDLNKQFISNTVPHNEIELENKQPFLKRRARDFFALFETPTGALLGASIIVVGVPLMVPVLLLAGIPLYVSHKKNKIDNKRAENIGVCEAVSDTLQMGLNTFKSKLNGAIAKKTGTELEFEKAAKDIVREATTTATAKPVRSSSVTALDVEAVNADTLSPTPLHLADAFTAAATATPS